MWSLFLNILSFNFVSAPNKSLRSRWFRTSYGNHSQKQQSRGILRKRCSENMQQIYRRTPTPKCDFNKVAKQLYWIHTLAWMFSCKFAAYFQNTFLKNTSGRLILNISFIKSFIPVEYVCSFPYVINCIFRNLKLLSYVGADSRSSCSEVFLVKGVLKTCRKFTGEHSCRSGFQ